MHASHAWLASALVASAAAAPTFSSSNTHFTNPKAESTGGTPLSDFSFLLTFTETVQKGDGYIKIGGLTNAVVPLSCASAQLFDRVAMVPVATNQALFAGIRNNVSVPKTCFRSADGEALVRDRNFWFNAIAAGGDTIAPDRISGLKPQGENDLYRLNLETIPLDPPRNAWVSANAKYTFYFTEGVKFGGHGNGKVGIRRVMGPHGTVKAVVEEFAPDPGSSKVKYRDDIPGMVEIFPSPFPTGSKYSLRIDTAAFQDIAGNFMAAQFTGVGVGQEEYEVKVSTTIKWTKTDPPQMSPPCCASITSKNFTMTSKVVLEFQDIVGDGSGTAATQTSISLCRGWKPDNFCVNPLTLVSSEVMFLGRQVLLSPQGLVPTQSYNLSIPSTYLSYYDGLSSSDVGIWEYGFSVEAGTESSHTQYPITAIDTGKPELAAARVDCNGDGSLLVKKFTKLEASAICPAGTFLPTAAKCDEAASASILNLADKTSATVTLTNRPKGCYYEPQTTQVSDSHRLYFNDHVTGGESNVAEPICSTKDIVLPEGFSDRCDRDADGDYDFLEMGTELSEDAGDSLPLSAKFKLYFKEKVDIAASSGIFLYDLDSQTKHYGPPTDSNSFTKTKGSGSQDCVITLSPGLTSGTRYALHIESTAITDHRINAYAGTVFTFYTPLQPIINKEWVIPSNASTNVDVGQNIRFSFQGKVQLGDVLDKQILTLSGSTAGVSSDMRQISLADTNQVIIQERELLLAPRPLLKPSTVYTVTLRKGCLKYLIRDYSTTFTTRSRDTKSPTILVKSGSGTFSKVQADNLTPYVLFSEGVKAGQMKNVWLKEDGTRKFTMKSDDSTCGFSEAGGSPTDACVEIFDGRGASFYPLGKTTAGRIAPWATAGKTYSVEIETGAFSDEITTGARYNMYDAAADPPNIEFSISEDVTGPTAHSMSVFSSSSFQVAPLKATDMQKNVNSGANGIFLSFNEDVQAGDNTVHIKAWDYGGDVAAPKLVNSPGTVLNGKYAMITLTFDMNVQAGSGTVGYQMVKHDDSNHGTKTVTQDVISNKVLFKPQSPLLGGTKYYVTSDANLVANAYSPSPTPSSSQTAAMNTKKAGILFGGLPGDCIDQNATWWLQEHCQASRPTPVWTSLDEYVCTPANGMLSDIVLYMNEDIEVVDGQVRLCNCGAACSSTSCGEKTIWTRQTLENHKIPWTDAYSLRATIDSPRKFVVTLRTAWLNSSTVSSLPMFSKNQIWLDEGLLQGIWDTDEHYFRPVSRAHGLPFGVCEVKFDNPLSNTMRLYSPLEFSKSASLGPIGPRRFLVAVPRASVLDNLGNIRAPGKAPHEPYEFTHEIGIPTLVPMSSNPPHNGKGDYAENIVLAFNEVIQAGTGSFEIYAVGGPPWDLKKHEIAMTASASNLQGTGPPARAIKQLDSLGDGHRLISGRFISISPKTLCNPLKKNFPVVQDPDFTNSTGMYENFSWPRMVRRFSNDTGPTLVYDLYGRPSIACDHPHQGTYYLKTTNAGVVKDVVGNPLPNLNTMNSWRFEIKPVPGTSKPRVAYLGGYTYEAVSGFSYNNVTGYIYFTEKIEQTYSEHHPSHVKLSIQDCGVDMRCNTASDNGVPFHEVALSYGDGSTMDGTTEYGLMRYTRILPKTHRRYKVTVPQGFVKAPGSAATDGIASAYTFYISAGRVSEPSYDSIKPVISRVVGMTSGDPMTHPTINPSANIVLEFNEDVQAGSDYNVIHFCLNSDAEIPPPPNPSPTVPAPPFKACNPGKFANNVSAVNFPVSNAAIDRRILNLTVPRGWDLLPTRAGCAPGTEISSIEECDAAGHALQLFSRTPSNATVQEEWALTPGCFLRTGLECIEGCENEYLFFNPNASGTPFNYSSRAVPICRRDGFKTGQSLYMMLPHGFVTDTSISINSAAGLDRSNYSFRVAEEDFTEPLLEFFSGTSLTAGKVQLVFSEAVQVVSQVRVVDKTQQSAEFSVQTSSTITGNRISISGPPWTAGRTYRLDMSTAELLDLSGNMLAFPLGNKTSFQISGDTVLPTIDQSILSIGQRSVLPLTFSEVVQKGTGKFTIYSTPGISASNPPGYFGCGSAECAEGTMYMEGDIKELPLVTFAQGDTNKLRSATQIVGPTQMLKPWVTYSLRIPSTAFSDMSGNAFDGLTGFNVYSAQVTTSKDVAKPQLNFVDVDGGSPNPAFRGSGVDLYFSEQMRTPGGAELQPSDGKAHCSAGGFSTCLPGTVCDQPCGWSAASGTRQMSYIVVEGAKVMAGVPGVLPPNEGFKLSLKASNFKDLAGNTLAADVDGDADTGPVYTLRVKPVNTDTIGPQHLFRDTIDYSSGLPKKELIGFYPTHGATMVPPSSTLRISFNEVVQASIGSLKLQSAQDLQNIPASSCLYAGTTVLCEPPLPLARNSLYSVKYYKGGATEELVKDVAGNKPATAILDDNQFKWHFRTIDLDLTQPRLAAVSLQDKSFAARRLAAEPIDPTNGAIAVAKGSIVSLTFTETVQAGVGTITLSTSAVSGTKLIDVQNLGTGEKLFFSGSTVFLQTSEFTESSTYTLQTNADGVFKDVAGQPLAKINADYTFTIVSQDSSNPGILLVQPRDDVTVGDDAPSTDITLYFSEAVQAIDQKTVTVCAGVPAACPDSTAVTIPVDNQKPEKGRVTVAAGIVQIDPFDDVGYDRTITVKVPSDAFKDFAGNVFQDEMRNAATKFQSGFKTPIYAFLNVKQHNLTLPYTPRAGMILHVVQDLAGVEYLAMFGGWDGTTCLRDATTSFDMGKTWSWREAISNNPNFSLPAVANPAHAIDANFCMWMLGGGRCNNRQNFFWRSCSRQGRLEWEPQPVPSVRGEGVWPDQFDGHAIAVLGGWQLVVVDAPNGYVWHAVNRNASRFWRAAKEVPWVLRRDPALVASSNGTLYLMGGHNCKATHCTSITDRFGILTDVWTTDDAGATWRCLTVNFDASLTFDYNNGLGRFFSALITHDDTIFIAGGANLTSNSGLNTVFTSYVAQKDQKAESHYTTTPSHLETGVQRFASVKFYFKEAIRPGTGTITMADLGQASGAATEIATPITVSIDRQVLTITPKGMMNPGHDYGVAIPGTALTDTAGNNMPPLQMNKFRFSVTPEVTKPVLEASFPTASATAVAPWTTIKVKMSTVIAKGAGSLLLESLAGEQVSIDVSTADVIGQEAVFPFPESARLQEGQEYTVNMPEGLFTSITTGNPSNISSWKFTVLSGMYSSHPDGYQNRHLPLKGAGDGMGDLLNPWESGFNASLGDFRKPLFVSMSPGAYATDVPGSDSVRLALFFDEPVRFRDLNRKIAGAPNASANASWGGGVMVQERSESEDPMIEAFNPLNTSLIDRMHLTDNGVTFKLGKLKPGHRYEVFVPSQLIVDFAGNTLPGDLNYSFTCLNQSRDTEGPSLVMSFPQASTNIDGSKYRLYAYFSEDIMLNSTGEIVLNTNDVSRVITVPRSNMSVSGPKLTVELGRGSLNRYPGTRYFLQIPQGLIFDKTRMANFPSNTTTESGGNSFPGVSDHQFVTKAADVLPPILLLNDCRPSTENQASTYEVPVSVALMLKFTDIVQSNSGEIQLIPRYSAPAVTISLDSPEVAFMEKAIVVSPTQDLYPGEVYTVVVSSGAVNDREGNSFAGLKPRNPNPNITTPYWTFSTAPLIKFRKLEEVKKSGEAGNMFDLANHPSYDFFEGQRYAVGVAIDKASNVYVIGGQNGTVGSEAVLNDVWKLATMRETDCGEYFVPSGYCLEDDGTSAEQCSRNSNGDVILGKVLKQRAVWRPRSAGGKQCVNADGSSFNLVGQVVKEFHENCPCPECWAAPKYDLLPDYMTEKTYVAEYTYQSAARARVPIKCISGRKAWEDIICEPKTHWRGWFIEPYPLCEWVCESPPPLDPATMLAYEDGHPCADFTVENPQRDGASCNFTCIPGYQPNREFTCVNGSWAPASCVPMPCAFNGTKQYDKVNMVGYAFADTECDVSAGMCSDPTYGSILNIFCRAGWSPFNDSALCVLPKDAGPGVLPYLNQIPFCKEDPPTTTTTTTTFTTVFPTFYHVVAALTIDMTLPEGVTADELVEDETFKENIRSSIFKGVEGAGLTGVEDEDVELISVNVVGSRRLTSAPSRLLADAGVRVDYRIKTAGLADANALAEGMKDPAALLAFQNTFTEELVAAEKEAGRKLKVNGIKSIPPRVMQDSPGDPRPLVTIASGNVKLVLELPTGTTDFYLSKEDKFRTHCQLSIFDAIGALSIKDLQEAGIEAVISLAGRLLRSITGVWSEEVNDWWTELWRPRRLQGSLGRMQVAYRAQMPDHETGEEFVNLMKQPSKQKIFARRMNETLTMLELDAGREIKVLSVEVDVPTLTQERLGPITNRTRYNGTIGGADDGLDDEAGIDITIIIAAGVGGLIAGVIVALVLRRRYKKKHKQDAADGDGGEATAVAKEGEANQA